MGILSNIFNKIFPNSASAKEAQAKTQAQNAPAAPTTGAAAPAAPTAAPAPAAMDQVDVEAILNSKLQASGQQLNWRTSIVDLLKLLDLDSSLTARKELGSELGVHAGADGTPEQNIALHKAVMAKLAENGGVVPDSLRN